MVALNQVICPACGSGTISPIPSRVNEFKCWSCFQVWPALTWRVEGKRVEFRLGGIQIHSGLHEAESGLHAKLHATHFVPVVKAIRRHLNFSAHQRHEEYLVAKAIWDRRAVCA